MTEGTSGIVLVGLGQKGNLFYLPSLNILGHQVIKITPRPHPLDASSLSLSHLPDPQKVDSNSPTLAPQREP